jgi:glutathione S-transferase
MEDTYKLTYFNIRGLAEPIRLLFHYAQVKFEDNRIEPENWPGLKQSFPWSQLPVLELGNGVVISQSLAINRFLAKRFNLAGETDLEAAQCDELVDALKDVHNVLRPAINEKDESKKHEMKVKIAQEVVPNFFAKIGAILEKNGGKYFVGKNLTWADLFYYNSLSQWDDFLDGQDIMENNPTIAAYLDGIFKIPQIKSYIAKRPFSTR